MAKENPTGSLIRRMLEHLADDRSTMGLEHYAPYESTMGGLITVALQGCRPWCGWAPKRKEVRQAVVQSTLDPDKEILKRAGGSERQVIGMQIEDATR